MDLEDIGLRLVELGVYIFPCDEFKKPLTAHGHLDASVDVEVIGNWLQKYSDRKMLWGVHAGRSGLLVADVDRKTGRDGFVSISDNWLELTPTFHYATLNNGEHHIYQTPPNKVLPPSVDYRGFVGLDRRSGSSYFIYWGTEVPESRDAFGMAPSWILDEGVTRTGAAFEGGLDDWLAQLEVGSASPKIKEIISNFPEEDFSHSDMVERQMELIRLGAERHSGVWDALDELRTLWLNRDPALHSTPEMDWAWKFDEALYSGIAKFGATSELLTNLPDYSESLDMLPDWFDVEKFIFNEPQSKKFYFRLMEQLVNTELPDDRIISILWHAPTVKRWSVEWGEQYLTDMLKEKRNEAPKSLKVDELPTPKNEEEAPERITLLSDEERDYLRTTHTWVDLYLEWIQTRLPQVNEPYHIMQALTILSAMYAPYGYIATGSTLNLNLYCISLGESSTGKTQSEEYRDKVLFPIMREDRAYLTGDNPSPNGLHDMLLNRDGRWTLFASSEIAGFLATAGAKNPSTAGWMTGMLTQLTKYYDGYIPPMVRVGRNSSGESEDAHGYLSIAALGTPDKVFELLTKDLFTDGFLARFLWSFGTPPTGQDEDNYRLTQQDITVDRNQTDPEGFLASESLENISIKKRQVVWMGDDVLERGTAFIKRLRWLANRHDLKELILPSFTRLGDNILKIAALFAMSEGFNEIKLRHLLQALKYGEMFANSVLKAAKQVTETKLQKDLDEVYAWIQSKGQYVEQTALAKKFAGKHGRDYKMILNILEAQGYIEELNIKNKAVYVIK